MSKQLDRSALLVGKGNRYELFISFALVLLAALLTVLESDSYILFVLKLGCGVLGFVCALNAFLHRSQLGHCERFIAIVWFALWVFVLSLIALEFLELERFNF